MIPASAALRSAFATTGEWKPPPRLIEMTSASTLTACRIALATGVGSSPRTTELTQRTGATFAPGAEPKTPPAARLATTLAVEVPCPGFCIALCSGSEGSAVPSRTLNAFVTSSAWFSS